MQYRIDESWISRIVAACLRSIVHRLLAKEIPAPTSETWRQSAQVFENRWNFPNCVGAIDGKHFRIRCPDRCGSEYWNYKEYHSIILLAIVDARYKFIAVDIGSYGREGDAGEYRLCICAVSFFLQSLEFIIQLAFLFLSFERHIS